MNINTFCNAFLDGWGYAHTICRSKVNEDAARRGCNRLLAGGFQFNQILALSYQVEKLIGTCRVLSSKEKITFLFFTYFSVPGIATLDYLIEKKKVNLGYYLNRGVKKLSRNLGSLCQLASVITSIALLAMGFRVYALTSLSILAMGYLERHKYLPAKVKNIYASISPWLVIVSTLTLDSWFFKILLAFELIDKVHKIFFKSKATIPFEKAPPVSNLNYIQFQQVISKKASIVPDRSHVDIIPFPIVKELNFQPLLDLYDSIKWSNKKIFAELDKKIQEDARWQDSEEFLKTLENPEKSKKLKLCYAKKSFFKLVHDVDLECIETGAPLNYAMLKNYLGYIALHLPKAPKDLQLDILANLAIEGGDYCGTGVYYQLEKASFALLYQVNGTNVEKNSERPRLPLKQRILILLQQERLKIALSFHELVQRKTPTLTLLDGGIEDVHAFNKTIQRFAYDFGLPDQGAQEDDTANTLFWERYYYQKLLKISPEDLWTGTHYRVGAKICAYRGYNERLLKAITCEIGQALIPRTDIFEWATQWIERQDISPEEKEKFLNNLEGDITYSCYQKFNPEFIQAMLVDMGILKIA